MSDEHVSRSRRLRTRRPGPRHEGFTVTMPVDDVLQRDGTTGPAVINMTEPDVEAALARADAGEAVVAATYWGGPSSTSYLIAFTSDGPEVVGEVPGAQ